MMGLLRYLKRLLTPYPEWLGDSGDVEPRKDTKA